MSTLFARVLACALCWACLARNAEAQAGGHWLVLPYGVRENDAAVLAADRVQVALQELELTVISAHEARDKYVSGSRRSERLEDEDVQRLIKEGQEALEHVAYGRHTAAQKSVREALTLAERALETLNRKTEMARRVLDACLILVRSELGQGKRERALETAMRCRRLVPDVSPSETTHPASVIGVLAEAENKVRRWHVGKLQVDSAPGVGCPVYINGRHLGRTPLVLDRAAEGDYRVQVECDERIGRVHEVTLGEEPVTLTIDSVLDRALESEPRLSLTYAEPKLARAYGVGHATAIGKDVGADEVVLVSAEEQHLTFVRVQVSQGRTIAEVTLTGSASDVGKKDLEQAVEALLAGRMIAAAAGATGSGLQPPRGPSTGSRAGQPGAAQLPYAASGDVGESSLDAPQGTVAASEPRMRGHERERRLTKRAMVGAYVGGLGIVVLGIGWGYEQRNEALRTELRDMALDDPRLEQSRDDYDRTRKLTIVGLPGSALMTISVPFFLPKVSRVPWWSYLVGGVGLGLVGAGVAELAMQNRCISPTAEGTCLERREQLGRASLLIESGVPLLAVPVTHALRLAWGSESRQIGARVTARDDSVMFGAEGSF